MIWIIIIIASVIVELVTAGMTLMWVAIGGAAAYLSARFGVRLDFQIAIFLGVSLSLMYFIRPYLVKFINKKRTKAHLKQAIGKSVRVLEDFASTDDYGKVFYNGMEWLALVEDDNDIFKKGETAVIAGISGMRLVIRKG